MSWKQRALRRLRRYGWLVVILTAAIAGTIGTLGRVEDTLAAMVNNSKRAPASVPAPHYRAATPSREPLPR